MLFLSHRMTVELFVIFLSPLFRLCPFNHTTIYPVTEFYCFLILWTDYDDEELLEISLLLARQYGYTYGPMPQQVFTKYIKTRKEFPYFSNARTVRNAMERARRLAATRILKDAMDKGTKYTMSQIQTFQPVDFQIMLDEIKNLPRDTMLP